MSQGGNQSSVISYALYAISVSGQLIGPNWVTGRLHVKSWSNWARVSGILNSQPISVCAVEFVHELGQERCLCTVILRRSGSSGTSHLSLIVILTDKLLFFKLRKTFETLGNENWLYWHHTVILRAELISGATFLTPNTAAFQMCNHTGCGRYYRVIQMNVTTSRNRPGLWSIASWRICLFSWTVRNVEIKNVIVSYGDIISNDLICL